MYRANKRSTDAGQHRDYREWTAKLQHPAEILKYCFEIEKIEVGKQFIYLLISEHGVGIPLELFENLDKAKEFDIGNQEWCS